MAGIYGAFDMNGTAKTEALAALLNKMSSYTAGSEGQAHLCEQLAISSKRLSNQNIGGAVYDNNRGISVAFEGEIYNKAELREKLSQSGVKPSDNSDAQIILELFGLYKTKCFELLKGMYAFLVYSKEDNALYLVRDRAGEKPLYYAQKDGILLFSGDLNCISCSNVVSKNINATALGQYLLIGYIPSPLTIYEEISAVEPGTYLKITQNGIEHNEYWKLVCSEEAMITDYDKCKSQLRNTLIKSVEDCIPQNKSFGVFLSGGIDSTIITGIASKILGREVNSFNMGFTVEEFDESDRANIAAKAFNTKHHTFKLDFDYALQKLDDVVNAMPQPFADRSAIPTYIINEFAKKQLDIVLTGDASDQMFAGSNKYLVNHYVDKYEKIPKLLRKGIFEKLIYALPENNAKIRKIRKVIASAGLSVYERREQMLCLCMKKPELKKMLLKHYDENCMLPLKAIYDKFEGSADELTRTLYMDLKVVVEGGMIAKMGTMSRFAGVETRTPMVSREMMELAYKIPSEFKQKGTVGKVILKDAFGDIIPEPLKIASKKGFDVPIRDWFCGPLKGELEKTLSRDFIETQGIFDYSVINGIMQDHFSRKADRSNLLWALYVFEKWAQKQ